jgi:hypothetical protein
MKRPSAVIAITKTGRRFVVCPSCAALQAPVMRGATQLTCGHCGCEFAVREPQKRKKACSDDAIDSPPGAQP